MRVTESQLVGRVVGLALLVTVGCSRDGSPPAVPPQHLPRSAAAEKQGGSVSPGGTPKAAATIGEASMRADGTLVLDLVTTGATRGQARLSYPPSHPEYRKVLAHLGGLRPGERKPVPPWRDAINEGCVAASVHAYLAGKRGWKRDQYRFEIVGTDAAGRIAVTVGPVDPAPVRHPGGGRSIALRLDPRTCAVVEELLMK